MFLCSLNELVVLVTFLDALLALFKLAVSLSYIKAELLHALLSGSYLASVLRVSVVGILNDEDASHYDHHAKEGPSDHKTRNSDVVKSRHFVEIVGSELLGDDEHVLGYCADGADEGEEGRKECCLMRLHLYLFQFNSDYQYNSL